MSQLKYVLKKYKTGSAIYRSALAEQDNYLDQLDELFPWIEADVGSAPEPKGSGASGKKEEGGEGVGAKGSADGAGAVGGGAKSSVAAPSSPVQFEWYVGLRHLIVD